MTAGILCGTTEVCQMREIMINFGPKVENVSVWYISTTQHCKTYGWVLNTDIL